MSEEIIETPESQATQAAADEIEQTDILQEVETPAQEQKPEEEEKESEKITEEELKNITDLDKAKDALEARGFDYIKLQKEFIENGDLTEKTCKELEKIGISKESIDSFIADQKVKDEKLREEVAQVIGGKDEYNAVIDWASKNLSEEEIVAIDSVYDITLQKIIIKELKHRMQEKEGVLPQYLEGKGTPPPAPMFQSQAEMEKAISDPRYSNDTAYREEVRKKVAASRAAGVNLGC